MKNTNFFSALKIAIIGIRELYFESRNARIQFVIFSLVLVAGLALGLNKFEWLWLFIASTLVLALEAINTSIELLADVYTLEFNAKIKQVKDIAAGAVLIASIFAFFVGLFIFIPHLSAMFKL
ncbi:MAG: diacylglycerol kinase [Bacteroidota bacterium]|jgi:diacylglycerol kinase